MNFAFEIPCISNLYSVFFFFSSFFREIVAWTESSMILKVENLINPSLDTLTSASKRGWNIAFDEEIETRVCLGCGEHSSRNEWFFRKKPVKIYLILIRKNGKRNGKRRVKRLEETKYIICFTSGGRTCKVVPGPRRAARTRVMPLSKMQLGQLQRVVVIPMRRNAGVPRSRNICAKDKSLSLIHIVL